MRVADGGHRVAVDVPDARRTRDGARRAGRRAPRGRAASSGRCARALRRTASLRAYIGTPPRATRQTSPMPCSRLARRRDRLRPRRRRAARGRCPRGCGWRRCTRAGTRASISVAPCRGARAPQPRDVRVLGPAHDRARRRVVEVGRIVTRRSAANRAPAAIGAPRRIVAAERRRHASCVSASLRWHAEQAARARSRAAAARPRGSAAIACGQRGWKWQPGGGSSGDGISPLIGTNVRLRGSTLPHLGEQRLRVRMVGRAKSSAVGALSTTRPEVHDHDAVGDVLRRRRGRG